VREQDGQVAMPITMPEKQVELTQEEIAQASVKSGYKIYREQYSNYEYGYTVSLPEGYVGISNASPHPQHGFGITLSNQPKAEIWVDGSYNSLMWISLNEAIDDRLNSLKKENGELVIVERESTTLQNLPAVQVTARYKTRTSGEVMVQVLVMAIRSKKLDNTDDEIEIIHTIGLRTPESRFNADKVVFEQVVSAWRVKPLEQ